MTSNRRKFIRQVGAIAGAFAIPKFVPKQDLQQYLSNYHDFTAQELATNEDFWKQIRQAYSVSPSIVNLNNGGVCPQPRVVQEAVEHYNRLSNETPSYYMWRILDQGREPLREKLAALAGCSNEEIAINRNASEALETIIFGLRLKAGDQVVLTKQDYPNMINAYKQREHRDGIELKWISFDFPIEDKQSIIDTFVNAFTPQTKVVHLTHVINWVGQILPVKEIAEEARKRGIEVVVDAAHSFAQIDYKISDLGADYLGTSLHKWLCAPFGSGMIYVRKEKIKNLYPLFGSPDPEADDIRKFEHLGTRSFAIEQAISHAIDFHQMIGAERKEKRLHYLKNYWMEQLIDHPKLKFNTSLHPDFGCAIGSVGVEGKPSADLSRYLWSKAKIHTTNIVWENIEGVRITPNVYTLTYELDKLVKYIKAFISDQ